MTSLDDKPEVRSVAVTKAQVSAARLQLTIDRSLGRETPDWVRRVADAKPEVREAASDER